MDSLINKYIIPKLKFASTSAVATAVDYLLYLLLVELVGMPKVTSNLISASCGFLINFILQKRYVFVLRRKVHAAFIWSVSASVIGIGISTLLIHFLSKIPVLDEHQFITKLIVIGLMFFYNYYTKRFAFERGGESRKSV